MERAELGDDVFREDPTVIALEKECAERLGKEAALFVPSGTMANSIGIAVSTRPGDEILIMEDAHSYLWEAGSSSRLWGVHPRPLRGEDGCLTPEQVRASVRPDDPHCPRTSLVLLENTHNMQGGIVVTPERIAAVADEAHRLGLLVHLDGARIFNAAVASGRPAAHFTASVDTVSFCFSKGLSCPVGSVIAGDASFMDEALRVRKVLGGAMRQVGILAACARVALSEGIERLGEDHARAARLARELGALPGVSVHPDPPHSNMLMVSIAGEAPDRHSRLEAALEEQGVLTMEFFGRCLRLVTHRNLDDSGLDRAIECFSKTYEKFM